LVLFSYAKMPNNVSYDFCLHITSRVYSYLNTLRIYKYVKWKKEN